MAKESMKAREVKRAKLVARYAEKRAALKQIVRTGDPAEAFEAAQKLQDLPKNSNPIRMHNRCKLTGRPKGYIRQFGDVYKRQLQWYTLTTPRFPTLLPRQYWRK